MPARAETDERFKDGQSEFWMTVLMSPSARLRRWRLPFKSSAFRPVNFRPSSGTMQYVCSRDFRNSRSLLLRHSLERQRSAISVLMHLVNAQACLSLVPARRLRGTLCLANRPTMTGEAHPKSQWVGQSVPRSAAEILEPS
jgi:hypothetical protein